LEGRGRDGNQVFKINIISTLSNQDRSTAAIIEAMGQKKNGNGGEKKKTDQFWVLSVDQRTRDIEPDRVPARAARHGVVVLDPSGEA